MRSFRATDSVMDLKLYLLAALLGIFDVGAAIFFRLVVVTVGVFDTFVVVVGLGFEPGVFQSLKAFGFSQALAGQTHQDHEAEEGNRPHQA